MKSDMDKENSDLKELEEAQKYSQMNEEELIKRIKYYEKKYGPYIDKRGFHNWKNLFRKPNIYEWTIFFMIIMALFIAWAYTTDIKNCKTTLNNLDIICTNYCNSQFTQESNQNVNLSDFIFKADIPSDVPG